LKEPSENLRRLNKKTVQKIFPQHFSRKILVDKIGLKFNSLLSTKFLKPFFSVKYSFFEVKTKPFFLIAMGFPFQSSGASFQTLL